MFFWKSVTGDHNLETESRVENTTGKVQEKIGRIKKVLEK
jgi:uncharacterized protein YjbJ (UPF0337 family)